MTKSQHKRDLYLRRKYNKSLVWYNHQLHKQHGKCAICRKKYNKKGELLVLAVDHDHKLAKLKVLSFKVGALWHARVKAIGWIVTRHKKRGKAIKEAKRILLRLSVRGLLCWPCNTALQKFRDNPTLMIASAKYIKEYMYADGDQ